MSFYNVVLNHDDIHGPGQIGPRGLPGIGFNWTLIMIMICRIKN